MQVNYRGADYKCATCGATGLKLWRNYSTFLDNQVLECAKCLTPKQKKGILDEDGVFTFAAGDQMGWKVPAAPTKDGETFWGYSSVDIESMQWWHALPTYLDNALEVRCLRNVLRVQIYSANSMYELWLRASNRERP